MTKYKIFYIVALFWVVFSSQAETVITIESSSNIEYYGKIDAVYSDELRLIVNDTNLNYSHGSQLLKKNGHAISRIDRELKQGSYIRYSVSSGIEFPQLKKLQIISEATYLEAQRSEASEP